MSDINLQKLIPITRPIPGCRCLYWWDYSDTDKLVCLKCGAVCYNQNFFILSIFGSHMVSGISTSPYILKSKDDVEQFLSLILSPPPINSKICARRVVYEAGSKITTGPFIGGHTIKEIIKETLIYKRTNDGAYMPI